MEEKKTMYITIPQYDGNINTFLQIELIKQRELIHTDEKFKNLDFVVEIINFESLITRQRNTQFRKFIDTGYDVWLMLDNDIIVSQEDILSMYDKVKQYNVVQYPYRIKDPNNVKIVVTGFKKIEYPISIVEQQGTGILQISRKVQLDIQRYQKNNDLVYKMDINDDKEYYDVFQQKIGRIDTQNLRTYLSEDWYFCKILETLGYDIYLDLSVTTHHITKNFWFTYSPELLKSLNEPQQTEEPTEEQNKQEENQESTQVEETVEN